jgi:hypothetical protein
MTKTLILAEDMWAQMEQALEGSERGRAVLAALAQGPPPLPTQRELIRLHRTKAPPPEAFRRAAEYRDAARQAGEDTRDAMSELILRAFDAGVGPRTLSRWSGLKESRIYEIVSPARATA